MILKGSNKKQVYDKNRFVEIKEAKALLEQKEKRQKRMQMIEVQTGLSSKEITARIKEINEKGLFKITAYLYWKWDMHRLEDAALEELLALMARRKKLKTQASKKHMQVDDGQLEVAALEEDVLQCNAINQQMLSKAMIDNMVEAWKIHDHYWKDEEDLTKLVVDMETMNILFDYTYEEYLSFDFQEKSLEERLTYLSGKERKNVLLSINDEAASDLFHDKHQTYCKYEKYFRREQACVYDEEDFQAFQQFCKKHPVFVKKPLVSYKGRGVEPIRLDGSEDLQAVMSRLVEENGPFVVEELIETHDGMKAMNPDSVNTVRVETFYNQGNPVIATGFMRVGKAGHFVDNGSAGGIIIPIHMESGILTAIGRDKTNVTYTAHPDTGITFDGYQIPKWNDLVKLSKKLALMTPEVPYIGWDFTLNTRGKWVIVEGNARPGGFGNQRSSGRGMRREFFDTIGKNPNQFK